MIENDLVRVVNVEGAAVQNYASGAESAYLVRFFGFHLRATETIAALGRENA
jgi:hypothetical protein